MFTSEQLMDAFNKAENETAEQFASRTCSIEDKNGEHTCPICYFRKRVRAHLGIVLPYEQVVLEGAA